MNYSSPLLYKGNFISDVVPISFYEYVSQELVTSYTNGFFVGHNNVSPFVYYEDYCQGFMSRSPINSLYQYVAQKTERTRITSKTDSSGWTTMLMENVLWVGKTLLTNTYTHNSGANRPNLASGKVPLTYNAILKGGFESDIEVGFQSVAICKNQNIVDRMKRVSQVKVTFENYEKIPQVNTLTYDYQQSFIDATPEIPNGYFKLLTG